MTDTTSTAADSASGGTSAYEAAYSKSIRDPEAFWLEAAKDID